MSTFRVSVRAPVGLLASMASAVVNIETVPVGSPARWLRGRIAEGPQKGRTLMLRSHRIAALVGEGRR